MGKIKYNLLPKQRAPKHNLNVDIDLYPYATELWEELEKIGIINRIKEIPQLGVIKVEKKYSKTRYDYIMLQLYLHQMIKKSLQGDLLYTYNNIVKATEFRDDYVLPDSGKKPSIGDVIQLLTILYNIGHFYNTFTASRAYTIVASENTSFSELILSASSEQRYKNTALRMLKERNYQRFHLLNSILILEKCDHSKASVSLGLEILYSYINESDYPDDHKLRYVFNIFKKVRTVSYMAYDLQISNTPFTIDLCNCNSMVLLLKELLSEYNDNQSTNTLVSSITKLLDDTVYNENSNAICYYRMSRRIVFLLSHNITPSQIDYYYDLFLPRSSILNTSYSQKRDYVETNILKLTFEKEQREFSFLLLNDWERTSNTRVGYYDRNSGKQTILNSIRRNCDRNSKVIAAFKSMRTSIRYIRKIEDVSNNDVRYLLSVKFFLYYLFDENPLLIKPSVDDETCVICTRGRNARKKELEKLLCNSNSTDDVKHEVQFMLEQLIADNINDTTITIPASIIVFEKNTTGRKLCEFDGLIIHPMRECEQVVFLEAKNTSNKPSYGKNCLADKLDKLNISYEENDIHTINHDAILKYTL